MADPSLRIVRTAAWQGLVRRLDAAVKADARLIEARDAVLRPVEILQAMAADARAALADDVLVADRLRAMLFLCWPYASVTLEARALLEASEAAESNEEPVARLFARLSAGGTAAGVWPAEQPAEPGVIDHAALLIVMLAASRVADRPFSTVFLATVHGIALSASAAEVLGRLDPRQPDAESMRIVLETLYLVDAARVATKNEYLRPFVLDPVERGRWRCLEGLFEAGEVAKQATTMDGDWDGATSHEILSVTPRSAAVGETVVVRVSRTQSPDNPLQGSEVVFASPGGVPIPAQAKLANGAALSAVGLPYLELEVEVPPGAVPGWIGFSRSNLIQTSNARRADLRAGLKRTFSTPCVASADTIDLSPLIVDYGARATPRRRAHNRFEGGQPAIIFAGFSPAEVAPGAKSELYWEAAGSDHADVTLGGKLVLERGPASGRLSVPAPASDDQDLTAVITPFVERDGVRRNGTPRSVSLVLRAPIGIAGVDVTQGGSPPTVERRPLDVTVRLTSSRSVVTGALSVDGTQAPAIAPERVEPGLLAFRVPEGLVRDGMTLSLSVTHPSGQALSRALGPYSLRARSAIQVVLARPAVAGLEGLRLTAEQAERAITRAAARLGLDASIIDLPFYNDDVGVMVALPSGDGDPSLGRVLEGLARSAALTPGFEHALWLALVPSLEEDSRVVARALPADAARSVAVATSEGIDRVLREAFLAESPDPRAAAAAPQLALVGTLDLAVGDEFESAGVTLREVRVDVRRSGAGAPLDSGFELVSVSADGREVSRQPLRVLFGLNPLPFAALVPVSDDVVVVELRQRGRTIKAVRRARGSLTLEVTPPSDEAVPSSVDWQWTHTHNARPRVSLLLKRGALATPAHTIDPCHVRATLPIWRFPGPASLVLHASDGWNSAVEPIGGSEIVNDAAVVVRRLSDGRFFADAPEGWELVWRLNGVERGNERTLPLGAADAGVLELEARLEDLVVRDTREVGLGAEP